MTLPTPRPPFDAGHYDRANENWICGHAASGEACPLGPSGSGVCHGGAECVPYLRRQRWFCARSLSRGGACDEGPLPDGSCCRPIARCSPVRSVLAKRRRTTLLVTAMALGVVLWIFSGPSRQRLTSPGDLSFQHASLENNQCSACHDTGDGSLTELAAAAISSQTSHNQSQHCVACHRFAGHELSPHTSSLARLDELTAARQQAGLPDQHQGDFMLELARKISVGHSSQDEIACASCHHEHQGRQADLTAMSDHQCQLCHASAFESFEHGHPGFANYPHREQSWIYFDHAAHFQRHFSQSNSRTCASCHVADGEQASFALRGFDQACGMCHSDEIDSQLVPGLPLLAVPRMDTRSFGLEFASWPLPSTANAGAASRVSPFIRLLLSVDKKFLAADELLRGVNLADLSQADSRTGNAARYYATSANNLLEALGEANREKISMRLAAALDLDLQDGQVREMSGMLPWELLSELPERWRDESAPNSPEAAVDDPSTQPALVPKKSSVTGWYWDDESLALRYRPTAHADPVLKMLLDLTVSSANQSSKESAARQLFDGLAPVSAAGHCLKCHTVGRGNSGATAVHWQGRPSKSRKGEFTWFSHGPHLVERERLRCDTCHEIGSAADRTAHWQRFAPGFRGSEGQLLFDAFATEACGFKPLSVSQCAQCHQAEAVRQNCLTCHNYHVAATSAK